MKFTLKIEAEIKEQEFIDALNKIEQMLAEMKIIERRNNDILKSANYNGPERRKTGE